MQHDDKRGLPDSPGPVSQRAPGAFQAWSEKEKSMALAAYHAGFDDGRIGKVIGRSRGAARKWRERQGLPANRAPGQRDGWSAEEQAIAKAAHARGALDEKIAELTGRTRREVSAWRLRQGLASHGDRARKSRAASPDGYGRGRAKRCPLKGPLPGTRKKTIEAAMLEAMKAAGVPL